MGKREFIVAGNWKMHKSPREAVQFLKDFLIKIQVRPTATAARFIFFAPALDLWVTQEVLRATEIGFGAQNCHFEMKGAFTGENSPQVLAEIGCTHTLVGHSERRALFGETDEMCARKVRALQDVGLVPMLCVGETLSEREAGQTSDVILRQLRSGLTKRDAGKKFIIAYEPVWAIGTGKVATSEQANEAHKILRAELRVIGGDALADTTSILYGGSVKADNARELGSLSDVDGFLIGGASLEVDSFLGCAH